MFACDCLSVSIAHVWVAAVERVRQDQGSLYGQGSLKTYQEALSHQILPRAFHWHVPYSKVTGLNAGQSAILKGSRGMIMPLYKAPLVHNIPSWFIALPWELEKLGSHKTGQLSTLWRMLDQTHANVQANWIYRKKNCRPPPLLDTSLLRPNASHIIAFSNRMIETSPALCLTFRNWGLRLSFLLNVIK